MATADPSEDFSGLYANGTAETFLNLTRGMDTLTIGFEDTVAGTAPVQQTFTYGIDFTTVQDLVNVVNDPANGINTFFTALDPPPAEGQVRFAAAANGVRLTMISDTSSALNQAFGNVDGRVLITAGDTVDSDEFAHIAKDTDKLVKLRNAQGNRLDLQANDLILLKSATIGGNELNASQVSVLQTE